MSKDYYKQHKFFKTIQLILLVLFAVTFFCLLYFDPLIKNNIYSNRNLLTICVFIWAFMIYSAICIIFDFKQLGNYVVEHNRLNQSLYVDNLTNLYNRNALDKMIEDYSTEKDISNLGCTLLTISNLDEINSNYGREAGDKVIKSFSSTINNACQKYGVIFRNGGNEFLSVIENCDMNTIESFAKDLNNAMSSEENHMIELSFAYILNANEGLASFTDIISKLYRM